MQHFSPIITLSLQRIQLYSPKLEKEFIVRFHGSMIVAVESNEQLQSTFPPNNRTSATLYFLMKNGLHRYIVELTSCHNRDLSLYFKGNEVVCIGLNFGIFH